MKAKNKILTALLLSAGVTSGLALINKYIKMSAIAKSFLQIQTHIAINGVSEMFFIRNQVMESHCY